MASDVSQDLVRDDSVTQISARRSGNSIQHMHEYEQDPQGLETLHTAALNRSYDRITLQEQSTAIFGDIYGGVHYHIRPRHAIAQLPGQPFGQSDDTGDREPAFPGSNPEFPSWLLPFEQRDDFFGRQDLLNEIEGILFDRDSAFRRIAITGLGGAGKSRCAMETAYRIRRKRPLCSIFWIQGTDLPSVQLGYRNIAEALHLSNPGDSPEKMMELVRSHLNSEQADEFLLIIDDADDSSLWVQRRPGPYSSQPLLMDYLPRSSRGAIIVTTRSRQVAVQIAHKHVKQLPMLDRESAGRLLRSHLSDTAGWSSADASAIAEHLMCLPFALVRAADFVNQTGTSLQTLLRLLQDNEEAVAELLSAGPDHVELDNGKLLPDQKTWLVSISSIKQHHEHAFDMLACMSCLHHLSIPHELIPTTKSGFHQISAIGLLKGYGLILSTDEDNNNAIFDLHWLAGVAVRSWLFQRGEFESTLEATITVICDILKEKSCRQLETCKIRSFWPHVEQLYTFSRDSKAQSRCSLLRCSADLFQARGMRQEELTCLDLLTRDTEIEDVLPPYHVGLVYARLGHLLLAQNSAVLAEEWLHEAVSITLNWGEAETRMSHWPQLVGDAVLVWDQLGTLGAMMVLAQRLVDRRLLAHESESQDTVDAIRTWIEACLKLYITDESQIVELHDLEKLVSLSERRLGEADKLTYRSRCALMEQQLQLPEHQKDSAFVQQALDVFDRVLGYESQQSASARQFLGDIQRTETVLQAQRVQEANERARDTELRRISGSIDQIISYARNSNWAEAAEALANVAIDQRLLASRIGNDALLLKGIDMYTIHRQGKLRESMQLAVDLLKQTNGGLERALYILLEEFACSNLETDPPTAASFLQRIWNTGCLQDLTRQPSPSKLIDLLGYIIETFRQRRQMEQAISLLECYRSKRISSNSTHSIRFSITDFLFPPGLCSWPQWFPQSSSNRRQRPGIESREWEEWEAILQCVFLGNGKFLLMQEYWEIDEVIRRLRLEATCPGYQRDREQSLKTGAFLAFLYVLVGIKILGFLVATAVVGAVIAAGAVLVGIGFLFISFMNELSEDSAAQRRDSD